MKELSRQIRMAIAQMFIGWAARILPKDCHETWEWLSKQPFEN